MYDWWTGRHIGHLKIADGVKIAGQTGISYNLKKPGVILQGSPALPITDFQRCYVIFRKLPQLAQKINELEKQLRANKAKQSSNK